ncbi:hypothetical protein GLAREA_10011 [Glarea lozoyensis ATCC 20868]|uniref:Heterokaryon incompatibility domain-containing protein n=1 Tax=Glarea lozoyensis (strain ATCC 20868 / MF5171) TaxID=1116229 RepID=S3D756_GLAL2|nr:uncharacterized protein GLAREA_10011 [Glarea lozoyensis ATCC 20868]EPE34317.1 hypothetical protein GLAREA_10011 [Glarea lozoyensis ATCC 20868]
MEPHSPIANEMDTGVFQYQPLPVGERPLRLLDILPSGSDNTIHCALKDDDLSTGSKVPFYAVSYTWGDPLPVQTIKVNGKDMEIRQNLYDFLLETRRRRSKHRQRLWIDAICINQDDVAERNQQVQQMAHIYQGAETVYTWLGLSDENSDRVFSTVQAWNRQRDSGLGTKNLKEKTRCIGDALINFFSRSYWSRLWILQEIYLAKKVELCCGKREMPLRNLQRFYQSEINQGRRLVHGYLADPPGFQVFYQSIFYRKDTKELEMIFDWTQEHMQNIECNLHTMLFKNLQCGDVRDKVYGFLGLVADARDFRVDYSVSYAELFFNVVRHFERFDTISKALVLMKELGLTCEDISSYLASCEREGKMVDDIWTRAHIETVEDLQNISASYEEETWEYSGLQSTIPHETVDGQVTCGAYPHRLGRKDLACDFTFADSLSFLLILRREEVNYKYLAVSQWKGDDAFLMNLERYSKTGARWPEFFYPICDEPTFCGLDFPEFRRPDRGINHFSIPLRPNMFMYLLQAADGADNLRPRGGSEMEKNLDTERRMFSRLVS